MQTIKVYYYTKNREDPDNDWDMLVQYGRMNRVTGHLSKNPIYPKKSDLQKSGYVLMPIPQSYWDTEFAKHPDISIREILEHIFYVLNSDFSNPLSTYGNQQYIRQHRTHTPMSMGDVAVVDGRAYVVTDTWKEIK